LPDPLPLSRLDWAIAGTATSNEKADRSGAPAIHATFHHWISSRTSMPGAFSDAGFMYPQPNSLILERGSMVNPATGVDTACEELWHDAKPEAVPGEERIRLLVLETHDDERGVTGRVLRLGRYVQGLLRVGDGVSLERWEWRDGWKRTVRMGDGELPCKLVIEKQTLSEGGVVQVEGRPWKVVEASG
jgi:hypothetical protein